MLNSSRRRFAELVVAVAYANPFELDVIQAWEREASEIDLELPIESERLRRHQVDDRPHLPLLLEKADVLRERIAKGNLKSLSEDDRELYQDLCLLLLYFQFRDRFQQTVRDSIAAPPQSRVSVDYFEDYAREFRHWISPVADELDAAHLFACHFQIRRAYDLIDTHLFGRSPLMQTLRADIWYSIFTHDLKRYRRSLFDRMQEISTLITGESGTGKELVARAIGLSRYVAFDRKSRELTESISGAFHPVNMAALSSQLIESELFGHSKGAFTGAIKDRQGWFEVCKLSHSVFLDEIGELDPTLQVKLLRVLQTRTFERIGETRPRSFEGKVIAATNRSLAEEIQSGRFRADVYYRLCADQIRTPSLNDQIQDRPDELFGIVEHLVHRLCPEESQEITRDVVSWIGANLPPDYGWPGNFRELEQCVRNIIVRKNYHPLDSVSAPSLIRRLGELRLSAAELTRIYATLIYQRTGSYVASGKILGVDRRTIKDWVLSEHELRDLEQKS